MTNTAKKNLSLLLILTLLVGVFAVNVNAAQKITTPATGFTSASQVEYQYATQSGIKVIVNWGARGEDCVFLSANAQSFYTGSNTYDTLSALSGSKYQNDVPSSELYTALQSLMKSAHTNIQNYQTTRQFYQYTDCVSGDSSKLASFYSGQLVNSAWDAGVTYNREHVWPDSKCLSTGRSEGDSADIMMLRPTIPSENGSRSNTAYGESSGYFDPGESVRGDCARILLYVYVRWGNTGKMWGKSGVIENMNILLKWMEEDPVDTWEMGRNDSVQSITGTRNVFVDYPELAYLLFAQEVPDMTTPSGLAKTGNAGGSSDPADPTVSATEPSVSATEPSVSGSEPSVSVTEPSVSGSEPSVSGTDPSVSGSEPSVSVTEPSVSGTSNPLTCSHPGTTIINRKAASCVPGYTGDSVCSSCGKHFSSGVAIPASGEHVYEDGACIGCGAQEPTDSSPVSIVLVVILAGLLGANAVIKIRSRKKDA